MKIRETNHTNVQSIVFGCFVCLFLVFTAGPSQALEEVKFIQEISADLMEPVDSAVSSSGDIYVLDEELGKIFVYSPDGKLKTTIAEHGTDVGQLHKPRSLALASNGDIIVADTGNSRVQVFKPNGNFAYQLGHPGGHSGQFKIPSGIAVDPMGYIFVADEANRTITQYSPKGVFLADWKVDYRPKDIAFDIQQNLYVLVPEKAKIMIYPPQEGMIKELTLAAENREYIEKATDLTVDRRGDIYLMELASHSIVKIDHDEKILFRFGSEGIGRGQFKRPEGIFADDYGRVYVADTRNKRLQVFEVTGSQKAELEPAVYMAPVLDFEKALYTGETVVDLNVREDDNLYALSDVSASIIFQGDSHRVIAKSEDLKEPMHKPKALYVDKDGRIVVTDTGNDRLHFLEGDGKKQYFFGRRGDDQSEFDALQGVAVDREGYIYVADTNNNRIQVFNSDGIYLRSFGKRSEYKNDTGPEPGTFFQPKDLAFDSKDHLYVLDYRNQRIQVMDKEGKFIREIGGITSTVSLDEPVDIAIDEHDYLYVADRGSHSVKIVDPDGNLMMEFGSSGMGPSYFPNLSAIASLNGKIYVADYDVDKVKVFKFNPMIEEPKEERYFLTRVSKPLNMENSSQEIQLEMARKLTLEQTIEELADSIGVPKDELAGLIRIEAEQILSSGQLRMTLSIPREVLPLEYPELGMK